MCFSPSFESLDDLVEGIGLLGGEGNESPAGFVHVNR